MAVAIARPRRTLPLLAAAGLILLPAWPTQPTRASAQEPASSEPPVFGVQTSTVLLDVVVRDKKGRLVRDLAAADFAVFEDGVHQTIDSFRVVDQTPGGELADEAPAPATQPSSAAAAPSPPAIAPAEPKRAETKSAPAVVAFVFDRLSPNARKTAHKAALSYTDSGHVAGDLVGVFSIDLALRTLQPFTNDLAAVRGGLVAAGAQANTAFASEREEGRRRLESVGRADDALAALGGQAGAEGVQTTSALIASQQAFDAMQVNMLRAFDVLERDQQGFATTNGLLAVVNGLKAIPGRKTLVFFSEGMAIPANVLGQFQSVIASANRANVAIYAVDAGGLRTESGTKEAREELVQSSQRRLRQEETGRSTGFEGAMNRQLERNEDMLRLSPESGLGQLADGTGGFLVRDTNDVRSGFGRITEDMRFHYVLSYAPTNDKLDGQFRSISVKLYRPDLRVQTRKGYLALRPSHSVPVRTYEAPALAQLDLSPRPAAFPLGVTALSFPENDRPGLVPVLVALSGRSVSWVPDPASGFRADFAVVVRIKDRRGREADRLSQDYRLSAPADKLEAARRGEVLFYREADLPPGSYTAEAVAFDALARTASVRSADFEVPSSTDNRLRLSSLMLVSRAEQLTVAEQETKNPLHFGEAILYPSMGDPFRKSVTPAVGFYFSVYGGQKPAAAPRATIELRQGARTLATLPTELPAPDASGRIQYAGALPLKSIPAGTFSLRVSVTDGAASEVRETPFMIE